MTLLQAVAVMWLLILMLQTRWAHWSKKQCLPPEKMGCVSSAVMFHALESTVLLSVSVWKQCSVFSLAVWPIWPSFLICSHDTSKEIYFPSPSSTEKSFFPPVKWYENLPLTKLGSAHYSFIGLCTSCMFISNNQSLFSLFTLLYFSIVTMTT